MCPHQRVAAYIGDYFQYWGGVNLLPFFFIEMLQESPRITYILYKGGNNDKRDHKK